MRLERGGSPSKNWRKAGEGVAFRPANASTLRRGLPSRFNSWLIYHHLSPLHLKISIIIPPGVNWVLEWISWQPMSQKSSIPDTAGQSPSVAAASQGSQMLPAHPGPSASASHGFAQQWGMDMMDPPIAIWTRKWIPILSRKIMIFTLTNNWIWGIHGDPIFRGTHLEDCQMIPLRNESPRPWTHQIHIGCLGAEICHGSNLWQNVDVKGTASSRIRRVSSNPGFSKEPSIGHTRPSWCMSQNVNPRWNNCQTMTFKGCCNCDILWISLNSIPWHELSLEMHSFRPGVDCMRRTSPSAGSQLHT